MTTTTFSEMDMFLARLSLDPPAVEVERFRMPPLSELPGSVEDRKMRHEHAWAAVLYHLNERRTRFEDQPRGATYKKDPARYAALVEKLRSK